jgi:ABC-2 type transport system permease protein
MTTTAAATADRVGHRAQMNLWRLEWLRLTRTPRAIALAVVYVLIGLVEPVVTKYENQLIGTHIGNGIRVYLPPPTPADGVEGYISEATLIGLVLVVALAAGALGFDSPKGMAIFLRTRSISIWSLIAPRYAVTAGAATVAYILGSLAAWYETDLLLGPLPLGGMLAGMLCGAAYLAFAVALVALAASLVRSTVAITGTALVILLALPILGMIHPIELYLPSALVNAPVQLVDGTWSPAHFVPVLVITLAASVGALALAVARLRAREV